MTLIASLATNDFLIQVGDTRVVFPQQDGSCVVRDDASNKLTWFDGRIVFGYSGIACLDDIRTDRWIASQLSHRTFDSEVAPLFHLMARAEESLKKSTLPAKYKRLAIAAVGWCCKLGTKDEYPTIWQLSNFCNSDGQLLAEANDAFTLSTCTPRRNERFGLFLTGWQPEQKATSNIKRQIKRALRQGQPPDRLLSLLVLFLRDCADQTDVIGKNLVSVYLPVQAKPTVLHITADQPFSMSMVTTNSSGKPISLMVGGPLSKAATFRSWNAGSSTPLMIGPNVATPQAADIMSAVAQFMGPMAQAPNLGPAQPRPPGQLVLRYELVPASRYARQGDGLSVHCEFTGLPASAEPALGQYELVFLWDIRELEFRDFTFGDDLGGESCTERSFHQMELGEFNPDDPHKAAIVFRERSLIDPKNLVSLQPSRLRLATVRLRSLTDGPIWLGGGFPKQLQSLLDATSGRPMNASVSVVWVNK